MAERVQGAEGPRRRRWYPWDKWTDGSVWRATQTEDFTCSPSSFQTALHQRARQQGLDVTTGSPEPGIVEFQFVEKASKLNSPLIIDQDALEAGYPIDMDPEPLGGNDLEVQ
jgi:hypothetical protein